MKRKRKLSSAGIIRVLDVKLPWQRLAARTLEVKSPRGESAGGEIPEMVNGKNCNEGCS